MALWVKAFATNRKLAFGFDGKSEDPKPFNRALPQGSQISPILFAITACAIFENQKRDIQITQKQDKFNTSYVDDVSLVQIGKDSLETTPMLEERTRIQMERATKLGLSKSQSKSELLHCNPSSSTLKPKPIESLPVITIEASNSIYTVVPPRQISQLGVIFYESLNFIPHARDAEAEGMKR
jgi:hypothetical protein